jgi:hypothetical protein
MSFLCTCCPPDSTQTAYLDLSAPATPRATQNVCRRHCSEARSRTKQSKNAFFCWFDCLTDRLADNKLRRTLFVRVIISHHEPQGGLLGSLEQASQDQHQHGQGQIHRSQLSSSWSGGSSYGCPIAHRLESIGSVLHLLEAVARPCKYM